VKGKKGIKGEKHPAGAPKKKVDRVVKAKKQGYWWLTPPQR
jgi:hypothetical protein